METLFNKFHCLFINRWCGVDILNIPSNIDMSDQLHFIIRYGRHADYNWMIHHLQYISMCDALRNFIFREVHHIIFRRNTWAGT